MNVFDALHDDGVQYLTELVTRDKSDEIQRLKNELVASRADGFLASVERDAFERVLTNAAARAMANDRAPSL